jgi:asparagine synthase (glutamine-hydrolysing)
MCGIAGIVGPGAAGHRDAVRRMVEAQKHRGPDGEGIRSFPSGHCVLGHRRLAILDLSESAAQPMLTEDGRFGLAYNGECYNFIELRNELAAGGETFNSTGDTEVVLRLLARKGAGALPRMNAMFALGLWDEKERRLLLARDRFGQKPLYYARTGKLLLFASEVRALLASGLVERRIDPTGIISYLSAGAVQGPGTIVKGLKILPRASYIVFNAGNNEKAGVYWTPPREKKPCSSRELRELFSQAVARHLISDVPAGLFLSGGIDSSATVAAAVNASKSPLRTLSVVFPEHAELSEAEHAKRAAESAGTEHQEIPLTDAEMLETLPAALNAMDQPTSDAINTYVVSHAARQAGLKVSISGLGGDELFGGYRSFRQVPIMVGLRRILKLFSPLSNLLETYPGIFEKKAGKLADTLDSPIEVISAFIVRRRLFSSRQIKKLAPGLADPGWISGLGEKRIEELELMLEGREIHDAIGLLEMDLYMGQTLLRDSDVMGMADGLEIRLPFLDAEFAECVLSLEAKARRPARIPKARFVEAMEDWLPIKNVQRPRQGFYMPFHDWIHGALREEVNGSISHLAGLGDPINGETVKSVFDMFLTRPGYITWSRPWSLFVLGHYLAANDLAF